MIRVYSSRDFSNTRAKYISQEKRKNLNKICKYYKNYFIGNFIIKYKVKYIQTKTTDVH